jgi:tripartite ATP-independent transporter DctP family solute receptor
MHTLVKASIAALGMACAGVASAQTVDFTLGTTNGAQDLSTQAMERWRAAMEERSGGELMMEISSGGALGGDQELLQQLATNEIQAHIAGPVVLHRLVPAYQCLEAEFVYDDEAHGFKVWRGPLGQEVSDALEEQYGIEIAAVGARGARQLTSNTPIRTPDDLEGVKIRVTNPLRAQIFEAYGALPGNLPVSELYGALLQGVFDAQENPIPTIFGDRFYEVQKFINMTGHVYSYNVVSVNSGFVDGLSDEQRAIFDETLAEAIAWLDSAVAEDTGKLIEQMKAERGIEIVEPDVEAFRSVAVPIVETFAAENCRPGLLDDVRAAAD